MRHFDWIHARRGSQRGGFALLTAVLTLAVVTSLAVALMWTGGSELAASASFRDITTARSVADSGLQYFLLLMDDCKSDSMDIDEFPDMFQVVHDHLNAKLPSSPPTLTGTGSARVLSVPAVALAEDKDFTMDIVATDVNDDDVPTEMQLLVTGRYDQTYRRVAARFSIEPDEELLHFGFASSVRMILRGNVIVHGPIASGWSREPFPGKRNHGVYPLDVDLGPQGLVEGTLGTVDSQEDFEGDPAEGDTDFRNGVRGSNPDCDSDYMRGRIRYKQPPVMDLKPEDFNTQPLKDMTSTANLPAADATGVSLGMWGLQGSRWEDHNGEGGKAKLNNICVPKGTNPYFKNCTFTGITYIEVDEETDNPSKNNQNGVVFEDCTFEGPVITGVPKEMRWDYNSMEYRGETTFRNSMIQAALGGVTLMAPNYNVNIGGGEHTGGGGTGDSAVCGLVVGGVVDVYDKIHVNGTVVSMAPLVVDGSPIMNKGWSWLLSTGVCGSNLGNINGTSELVEIWPDPDNVMPLGMRKKYIVEIVPGSFVETMP
ncbi:MAG: hypothetical protein GVY16_09965 [Planctomycetes bacterium]|jgi:hypothetical protein|nr:hypothetical protein [Phycisphaerae bacterium]NBB96048.1 hypothetical protein [Planctomycetota bacterium]